ncbi:MAG: ATP-binding cassette domain-containing protein, partial [Actinomycetota bacterium]
VLERVGLTDRAGSLVKTYSLGMRQRLGIAAALLKDPDVLILDEPANGLDPAGIVEVRQLLRGLGEEGRTVFVSSHILNEVQQTCDRVAILARGRCVASGAVDEVLSNGRSRGVIVRVPEAERALDVLTRAGMTAGSDNGYLRVQLAPAEAGRITRTLAAAGLYVTELRPDKVDLETVFLELTSDPEVAAA